MENHRRLFYSFFLDIPSLSFVYKVKTKRRGKDIGMDERQILSYV
mgnify:CR=1 FL=1